MKLNPLIGRDTTDAAQPVAHLPSATLRICQIIIEGDGLQTETALHRAHGRLPEDVLTVSRWGRPCETAVVHVVGVDAHGDRALKERASSRFITLDRPEISRAAGRVR